MAEKRTIVVGGGLAGLAAVLSLCERGRKVDVFSLTPVKRSHSVSSRGGINGCIDPGRDGDTTYQHFYDTVHGGDFLANQPPVRYMVEDAPAIIHLMARAGVAFNRTAEGLIDFRASAGTRAKRTAYAAGSTGQQLLYALDEQVRRFEAAGMVRKFEHWDMMSLVLDKTGRTVGITALDMSSLEVHPFRGEAVVLATGGPGFVFGKTTRSTACTGAAAARAYRQGAHYANGEFIQVHPTSIAGADKLRPMSEAIRGEGGRLWAPRQQGDVRPGEHTPESERLYFLEEKYPAYGNLVPRDVATREIVNVCLNEGHGIGGGREVYLDITRLTRERGLDWVNKRLGSLLDTYEKFTGVDARYAPMRVAPGVHRFMGGLWVDYATDENAPESIGRIDRDSDRNGATNIPGLYAAGEVDYQYHGANGLAANAPLASIHAGLRMAGPAAHRFELGQETSAADADPALFDTAVKEAEARIADVMGLDGSENPFAIWRELGVDMTDNCTVLRSNEELEKLAGRLGTSENRLKKCGMPDGLRFSNQSAAALLAMHDTLDLARVIVEGALAREESRGAHFKELPVAAAKKLGDDKAEVRDNSRGNLKRNDSDWLKTTIAEHSPKGPKLSYEEVDVSIVEPTLREYT